MNLDTLQSLTMDEINRMSIDELQSALQYGKKVLIKRYKTQKQLLGHVAPVFTKQGNPYKIKTTNISRNQTIHRLVKVVQQTKAPTTTVSGYKKSVKRMKKPLGLKEQDLNYKQIKKIWDLYDRLNQLHPALTSVIDYKKVLSTISDYVVNHQRIDFKNVDKVIKDLTIKDSETSRYYAEEEWNNLL